MNYEEEIEVCSINNIDSRTYPITSAYLSIDEELKQGEKYNFNENEDLSYLTFEIKKGKAISLFINIKELKKLLGKNIYETAEYSFPYYIIVTLHVRDIFFEINLAIANKFSSKLLFNSSFPNPMI